MVENQAYLFLVFSLTGVIIGILFDLFRVLRKSIRTADIVTYLEDILFWILSGILILYNIWYFNDGEIRLFMFLGIIMGIMIYMLTLSNLFIKIFQTILSTLIKILSIPFKAIIATFRKIYQIIKSIIKKIVKNSKNLLNFTNKKRNFEKSGE